MGDPRFKPFCEALDKAIHFGQSGPPAPPYRDPYDTASVVATVREAAALLPVAYRDGYCAPLERNLPALVQRLRAEVTHDSPGATAEQVRAAVGGYLEPIVGAVFDRTVPEIHAPLRRFEAVISDLYRSFLDEKKRASVDVPLIEQLPPLATFAHAPDQGPFTLPSDGMRDMIGAPIGVVSLPSTYRAHPLLWAALAHETGGHDVLHADLRLLPELRTRVRRALPSQFLGQVWAYWMDEAASDVYGLLNVGPAFALNLAGFFSSLVHQLSRGREPLGRLGSTTFLDGNALDVHPTDILRLHLALGVTESLTELSLSARDAYATTIGNLAAECRGDATQITFARVVGGDVQPVKQLPFDDMAASAREVGRLIATAELAALGGHRIQDIETWDDADEDGMRAALASFARDRSAVSLGDDAQLLAAATLAVYDDPGRYAAVTTQLASALDASASQDPVFGYRNRHSAVFRPDLVGHIRVERATRSGAVLGALSPAR